MRTIIRLTKNVKRSHYVKKDLTHITNMVHKINKNVNEINQEVNIAKDFIIYNCFMLNAAYMPIIVIWMIK